MDKKSVYRSLAEEVRALSSECLLQELRQCLVIHRHQEARLIEYLGEVDVRRLYAEEACSSMFVFCQQRLGMSEHEAYLRIEVARAVRSFPVLLDHLASGRLHLTGIARLSRHLTQENIDAVLPRALGKNKREIDDLIAEFAPRPDVPERIVARPVRTAKPTVQQAEIRLGPDQGTEATLPRHPEVRPTIEPLAPKRYKVEFTATLELKEKLETLQSLLGPNTGLAEVIDRAVSRELGRIEKKRYGACERPGEAAEVESKSNHSRYIPSAIKRAAVERDGKQCTFVSQLGIRCGETRNLQFDHVKPFSRGGTSNHVDNIRLLCPAHNLHAAQRVFGAEFMEAYIAGER